MAALGTNVYSWYRFLVRFLVLGGTQIRDEIDAGVCSKYKSHALSKTHVFWFHSKNQEFAV